MTTLAPSDEAARLEALYRYDILDTLPEREFDDIVKIASEICGTPVAVLNFIDRDRQWAKALIGQESPEVALEHSFCSRTIVSGLDVMVVPDAREDGRFASNPFVTDDEPPVVFYAGAPLVTRDGEALGSLCVVDHEPRELDESQLAALRALARQAVAQLDLRLMLRREREQVERLEELDRLKDRFVSVVTHELRTPLTSVKGYLDAVLEEPERLDADQLKFLGVASRNANRLGHLVDDLLDLMRAEQGRMTIAPTDTDLATLVRDALVTIAPMAERGGILIESRLEDGVVAPADPRRVTQVLDNLLSNAVKYSPGGGVVEVSLARVGRWAEVRVADSGIGIPEDERDRLFQSFFRASTAVDTGIPGTGLGRGIARGVVEAHGGTVELTDRPGPGSEFLLRLPV